MGVAMKLNKKRLQKGASMVQGKLAEKQAGGTQSAATATPGQASAAGPSQASASPSQASGGPSQDAIEKLKELGQLHDQGILTDEEFSTQKAQVLGG